MLRKLLEHLFGVKPRHLRRNKFVPPQVENRPRLTRQIPKLPEATSKSELKLLTRLEDYSKSLHACSRVVGRAVGTQRSSATL
jgi:hypothetical protein